MLLVVDELNSYMLDVEVECSDCMYNIGELLTTICCEHMHCCWVICSCIHDWWWRIYIHIGDDYVVFVASWGDDLGNDWYHMHIEVVSRRIAYFDMGPNCLCVWWSMWLINCILVIMWLYMCWWMIWRLNYYFV